MLCGDPSLPVSASSQIVTPYLPPRRSETTTGKTKKAFGWCEITTSKRRQNIFPRGPPPESFAAGCQSFFLISSQCPAFLPDAFIIRAAVLFVNPRQACRILISD
jgi:hypothetical protein